MEDQIQQIQEQARLRSPSNGRKRIKVLVLHHLGE